MELTHNETTCLYCHGPLPPKKPKARIRRFCQPECRQKYWAEHNRDRHRETVKRYRHKRRQEGRDLEAPASKALRQWLHELKSKPCHDCHRVFEDCCMNFDHRPGTDKKFNVGTMFAHHYSRELIEEELAKCDLVCACCHRIRTRDRRRQNGRAGIS